jgi:hypothetical protein
MTNATVLFLAPLAWGVFFFLIITLVMSRLFEVFGEMIAWIKGNNRPQKTELEQPTS